MRSKRLLCLLALAAPLGAASLAGISSRAAGQRLADRPTRGGSAVAQSCPDRPGRRLLTCLLGFGAAAAAGALLFASAENVPLRREVGPAEAEEEETPGGAQEPLPPACDASSDSIALVSVEADGTYLVLSANRPFVAHSSLEAQEVVGGKLKDVLSQSEYATVWPKLAQVAESCRALTYETQTGEGGESATFETNLIPLPDGRGHCAYILTVTRDVTRRKREQKALDEGLHLLRQVMSTMPIPVFYKDTEGVLLGCNAAFETFTGLPKDEIIGKTVYHIAPRNLADLYHKKDQELLARPGVQTYEATFKHADGTRRDVMFKSATYRGADGAVAGVVGVMIDVTDRRRLETRLRAMSAGDELTGLYNRRGFLTLAEQRLKAAHRAKRELLMVFADLDGMKQINDTMGHQVGDQALIETAEVLRDTFRESDIIARIGGDEFAVIAEEAPRESADTIASRLQTTLDAYNARGSRGYRLGISLGIAHYDPEQPSSMDELMVLADRLMYEQKRKKHL